MAQAYADKLAEIDGLNAKHSSGKVVWKGSTRLDVVRAVSPTNQFFVVAQHMPGGNMDHEYANNVQREC
ncbi:unnamed protein product [Adineta ricciae]|nr:unnamed protein product [Adineta ricciae]